MSSRMSDRETDRLFVAGRFEEAAKRLLQGYEEHGGESGNDSLLYLLDLGLALHYSGKNDEAVKVFRRADQLAEIKDYTSIAAEVGTLLTSENIKNYGAEDFENVLISVYLAICYAEMGESEDALVEARRVNRKLELMVSEGKRKYKQNAFARYLSATLHESEGAWDSAYIDYKKTFDLEPDFFELRKDLYRAAYAQRMMDVAQDWSERLALAEDEKEQSRRGLARDRGEIIVIYENGLSPEKRPHRNFYSIPEFVARHNPVVEARVEVGGNPVGVTHSLFNIEKIAIQNLEEKYAGIIAKKVAGVVVKESVAYGIAKATKEPWLYELTRLIFYVSDQADVRSWKLLPRDLQILRTTVEPGTHTVRVTPLGGGEVSIRERTVQVRAGQKVFVSARYLP